MTDILSSAEPALPTAVFAQQDGRALQPRAWQYGPDLYLSGERGAPCRKNVSNGARQDRRCGSCCVLIEMMTPMTLAVTLEVQRELETRAHEANTARRQHVERLRYDAELARRRYMKVDPDNRLVADTLEAEWNDKLRRHAEAAEEYERRSKQQAATLSAEVRQRILGLAEQLPQIWNDSRVDFRERKRIVRLLIDDVTLIKAQKITAHVRLSGGATRTLELERPLPHRPAAQVQARACRDRRPVARSALRPRDCRHFEPRRMAHLGGQALQPEEDRVHSRRLQTGKPIRSVAPPRHAHDARGRCEVRHLGDGRARVGSTGADYEVLQ